MAKRPSYTWLIEHLATFKPEQLQDWIAAISYVPRAHVPIEICDADFAYHWYRYVARLEDQKRKRLDDATTRLVFEMFASEATTEARVEILRQAHRDDHLKLLPLCGKNERILAQRTTRVKRAGIAGADGVHAVAITVYKRRQAEEFVLDEPQVESTENKHA